MARVLAQHRVRRGQLLEHAERDVGEVADRGRADGERHALPLSVERLERDERCPDQAGFVAELGFDDPERLVGGLDRLGPGRDPRRLEHEVAGGGAEAASDDDDVRVEDVDERADRGTEQPADLGERRHRAGIAGSRALDQTGASAPGPKSVAAARSAASPEACASRCPRPWQFPWQGWPPATTTMWPSSAQPR